MKLAIVCVLLLVAFASFLRALYLLWNVATKVEDRDDG
jgi:hypothetical protein